MANTDKLKSEPIAQLWDRLEAANFVMLGSPKPNEHMQPMAPKVDREEGVIWFYANASSELVDAIGEYRGIVHMCVADKDYQACLRGSLVQDRRHDVINRYWSPIVAAWFTLGRTDPDLTLLKFTPYDASIWASTRNPVKLAWEIGKSALQYGTPDVGERESIDFRKTEAFQIND